MFDSPDALSSGWGMLNAVPHSLGGADALRMNFPPEVAQKFRQWDSVQKYNPMETEKVEGNLRMTKIRRTIPITAHYFSNNNEREQPHR